MRCFGGEQDYYAHVILLDEREFPVKLEARAKGEELLKKVYEHLDLLERDYFGLRFIDHMSQTRWLDPLKLILKQMRRGPPYILYFGVKFYAPDPSQLQEEITRYQFFLQVKRDVLQGRLPVNFGVATELFSYSIQSELGDYDSHYHSIGYVSEFKFVPNQTEEMEEKVAELHHSLRGQVPSVAEKHFLARVKVLDMYGVDLHPARGEDGVEYYVGLKPAGVVIFKNKNKLASFLWPKICKIDFKGIKFYLTVKAGKAEKEVTYIFNVMNKSACKHLWKCCVEHHAFFRLERGTEAPPSKVKTFFRMGSGFRYSGRTQREVWEDSKMLNRPPIEVKRIPTKRYERRGSSGSQADRASSTAVGSQVQVRTLTQSRSEVITVPTGTNTPDGRMTATHGVATPSAQTDCNSASSPPWEQAMGETGLYTSPGNASPRSIRSSGSRRRSPKFPRPHRRNTGVSSGSDTDTSMRRKRSRSRMHPSGAYSSDEEGNRRRRRRSRHRHHEHNMASDPETSGRKRHQVFVSEPEDVESDTSRRRHARNRDNRNERDRHHHHHSHHHRKPREGGDRGSRSDTEYARVRSRRPDYQKTASDVEMLPALDVGKQPLAVARVKDRQSSDTSRTRSHHKSLESLDTAKSEPGYLFQPRPDHTQDRWITIQHSGSPSSQRDAKPHGGVELVSSDSPSYKRQDDRKPVVKPTRIRYSTDLDFDPIAGPITKNNSLPKHRAKQEPMSSKIPEVINLPSPEHFLPSHKMNGVVKEQVTPARGKRNEDSYIELVSGPPSTRAKNDFDSRYYRRGDAVFSNKSTVL